MNLVNNKRRNHAGITLISLVITIIILIILAGITMTLLIGENGIIKRAIKAKQDTENVKKEEEISLMKQNAIMNSTIQNINYSESTDSIANPDRGWYAYYAMNITDEDVNINNSLTGVLRAQSNLNQSLISFFVNLENTSGAINGIEDREMTQQELEKIDNALGTVRKYNKKVILRFRYILSSDNRYKEPSMDMMLKHIEQLRPIMQKNKDVITVVEAGFLGSSGEWTPTNYSDTESRQKILFKLLDVLPNEIMVNVRTPRYYREIFHTQNPIDDTTKYSNDYASRVGLHNDGYLGSSTDLGTYSAGERENELAWQNSHNQYTIFGGEASTDISDPSAAQYSNAQNAIKDMKITHCSYLNRNHYREVLDKWERTIYNGDNIEYKGQTDSKYIEDHLGYRYVLRESKISAVASQGRNLEVVLKIENTGFANMVHEKDLELIIEQKGNYYKAKSDIDVREWKTGKTSTVVLLYTLPKDMQTGEWNVYVKISDKLNQDYCVQFANYDTWDSILNANYVGKTKIESYNAGNNSKFAQISTKQQEGSNQLYKIEGRIIVDGKISSSYEWLEEDCLYHNEENNTKFYMRNDNENLYILIQDDRIKNTENVRLIMRVKTDDYIDYGWWLLGKRYPYNHVIVNTVDFRHVIDSSKGAQEKINTNYNIVKERCVEYKIPINSIKDIKEGVEIDYIGFDLSDASWIIQAVENLQTEYTYTVK